MRHYPMRYMRKLDKPYLVFRVGDTQWHILKSRQADNARVGAAWFCVVTEADGQISDMGSVYVDTVIRVGTLVYRDPTLPPDLLDFEPGPNPMALLGFDGEEKRRRAWARIPPGQSPWRSRP